MREFVLERIWYEVRQANINKYYAEELIDKQIMNTKLYNCVIAAFSTTGAAGAVLSLYVPLAASIIVSLLSILNHFYPLFFMKTEDITKLCDLKTDYTTYCNKLENLFCLAHDDTKKIPANELQEIYTKLAEDYSTKKTSIAKIFGKMNKKILEKATKRCVDYLTEVYHYEE